MLNLMTLKVGERVQLRSGAVGEVTDNLGDGIWVQLRLDAAGGEDELVHCEEITGYADAS